MQNIVQQQEALQSLSDEQLQNALNNPTGSAPPYLILTEIQRRQDMRKAYEGEKAQFQAQQPSVAAELMAGASGTPPPAAATGQGLTAFQEGGPVSATNYGDIYRRYLGEMGDRPDAFAGMRDRLAAMEEASQERLDDAAWMSLVRMGLATAASDATNVGQALGEGGLEGLESMEEAQRIAREDELARLGLESDIIAGEQARELADIEAAQRAAGAEVSALQSDRNYALDRERYALDEDIFDFTRGDTDRKFGLAQEELQFSKDEAERAQANANRQFELLTEEFELNKKEAERQAKQDAISNALADRRVTVEEALAGQKPALARNWDHFLSLEPEQQEQIMRLQGVTNVDSQELKEAQRLWGVSRKAVEKELEEDPTYLELSMSDDPAEQRQAEVMKMERVRERFTDDAPMYVGYVDYFGRATAAAAAQQDADRGLKIVGKATTPPPGAEVISLDGGTPVAPPEMTGETPGVPVTLPEGTPPSAAAAPPEPAPEWFTEPLGPLAVEGGLQLGEALTDYIRSMEIPEAPPGGAFTEPLYRQGLRGLRGLLSDEERREEEDRPYRAIPPRLPRRPPL